jgi:hypothetical protein
MSREYTEVVAEIKRTKDKLEIARKELADVEREIPILEDEIKKEDEFFAAQKREMKQGEKLADRADHDQARLYAHIDKINKLSDMSPFRLREDIKSLEHKLKGLEEQRTNLTWVRAKPSALQEMKTYYAIIKRSALPVDRNQHTGRNTTQDIMSQNPLTIAPTFNDAYGRVFNNCHYKAMKDGPEDQYDIVEIRALSIEAADKAFANAPKSTGSVSSPFTTFDVSAPKNVKITAQWEAVTQFPFHPDRNKISDQPKPPEKKAMSLTERIAHMKSQVAETLHLRTAHK